jgi:hypothetical protein
MHPVSIEKPEGKASWKIYYWFENNIKKDMEYNGAVWSRYMWFTTGSKDGLL